MNSRLKLQLQQPDGFVTLEFSGNLFLLTDHECKLISYLMDAVDDYKQSEEPVVPVDPPATPEGALGSGERHDTVIQNPELQCIHCGKTRAYVWQIDGRLYCEKSPTGSHDFGPVLRPRQPKPDIGISIPGCIYCRAPQPLPGHLCKESPTGTHYVGLVCPNCHGEQFRRAACQMCKGSGLAGTDSKDQPEDTAEPKAEN